jgi:hypothetical protein
MDIRKLKELCKAALPLVEQVEYSKATPKALLTALLEKTIELIENEHKVDDIMFTTTELIKLVKTGSITEQQAKKFKSDHYSETEKLLEKVNTLSVHQGHSDTKFKIKLSDTGEKGGAKNKKHHFIKLVEINEIEPKNNSTTVSYEAVKLPKPSWFAKPFLSIELSYWRLFLFLTIPLFVLLIGIGLFFQSILTPTKLELLVLLTFILIVTLTAKSIYPFYEANNLRIAISPQWLLRISQITAQIESVKLNKYRKNGRPYRRLEFVVYEGKCPVCNNTVEVEAGKRKYKGRLIGLCNESPREHVFSFDHVTKKGNSLT